MSHIQSFFTKFNNDKSGTLNSLNIQFLVLADGYGACSFVICWRNMITSWHEYTFYIYGTLSCEWIPSQKFSDADLSVVTWASCWIKRRVTDDLWRHDVANKTPLSWNDRDNEGLHKASWDNSHRYLSSPYFTKEVNSR